MAILGYGIDLLHLPRIASLIERRGLNALARRILSPSELNALPHEKDKTRFMAVRWASKEAVYKAVQPRFSPSWKDISVAPLSQSCPKPMVVFEGKMEHNRLRAHLSISHDGDYLVAGVLVEQDAEEKGDRMP